MQETFPHCCRDNCHEPVASEVEHQWHPSQPKQAFASCPVHLVHNFPRTAFSHNRHSLNAKLLTSFNLQDLNRAPCPSGILPSPYVWKVCCLEYTHTPVQYCLCLFILGTSHPTHISSLRTDSTFCHCCMTHSAQDISVFMKCSVKGSSCLVSLQKTEFFQ